MNAQQRKSLISNQQAGLLFIALAAFLPFTYACTPPAFLHASFLSQSSHSLMITTSIPTIQQPSPLPILLNSPPSPHHSNEKTTKMAETKSNTLFPLFLFLLSTAAATSNNNSAYFIRRSCRITLYPTLCYSSLAPYAAAVQQSPVKLAVAAANVSLAKIHDASSLAAAFQPSCAGRLSAAVRDCVSVLRAAADLTKQSAAEMGKLGEATKAGGMAWEVSNAQTWMSAAMTNEETCVDGLDGVRAARGAKVMSDRVGGVKRFTSNALALLNVLAHGN